MSNNTATIKTKMDYLKLLVDEIHSTTVATIGSDGHPQTRIHI